MGVRRGRSNDNAKLVLVSTSSVVVSDYTEISFSRKLMLMELYEAACPRPRLPLLLAISLTFGVSWGSISYPRLTSTL